MRNFRILCFALLVIAAAPAPLIAQTVSVVPTIALLRAGSWGTGVTVTVSGYYNQGDSGGGVLYSDSSTDCSFGGIGTVSGTNPYVINVTSLHFAWSSVALNMLVTSSGLGITNDPVVAFDMGAQTITLFGAASSSMTPQPFTLKGDNGGTSFVDAADDCFHRISSTYSSKEWGAMENFDPTTGRGNDDTSFLQNWLNAPQPHIAGPGYSIITSGLTCSNPNGWVNYNGTIEGPPPNAVATGDGVKPTFQITAGDMAGGSFTGTAMRNCMTDGWNWPRGK